MTLDSPHDPGDPPRPLFGTPVADPGGDEVWGAMPRFAAVCLLGGETLAGLGGVVFAVGVAHEWPDVVLIASGVVAAVGLVMTLLQVAVVWTKSSGAYDKLDDDERSYVQWRGMSNLVVLRAWGVGGHASSARALEVPAFVGAFTAVAAIVGVAGVFIGLGSMSAQTKPANGHDAPVCTPGIYDGSCVSPDLVDRATGVREG